VQAHPRESAPSRTRVARAPFLLLAVVCLATGVAGGLARMGVAAGAAPSGAISGHGLLMVVGFLATLIGLERAVALARPWAYGAPAATAAGALASLALGPHSGIGALALLGSALLAAVMATGWWRFRTPWLALQTAGAVALAVGTARFALGDPVALALPWWTAFPLLTIAGERLELSRIAAPPRAAVQALLALGAGLVVAAAAAFAAHAPATRAIGSLWLAIALWLLRYDLARRSLRRQGLPRFMAASLLSGYVWLALAGATALVAGLPAAGLLTDAVLHAFFLGFVIAMIFGHAPVIFPAVLGLPIRFSTRFYLHLGLLHAGLALRIAGDLLGDAPLRQAGGIANLLALLLFFAQTAAAAAHGAAKRPA